MAVQFFNFEDCPKKMLNFQRILSFKSSSIVYFSNIDYEFDNNMVVNLKSRS